MTFFACTAAVLLWIAAIQRLVVSFRGSTTLWRSSFTVAVVALAVGSTFFALGPRVDAAVRVNNLATLLTHLAVGLSAGGVTVYLLTLRSDTVKLSHVAGAVGVNLLALLAMTLSWIAAPFHDSEFADISSAPLTLASTIYFVIWYAYMTFVLTVTAIWCRTELSTTAHERKSVRIGLGIIGVSTSLGAFGAALGMVRTALRANAVDQLSALSAVVNTLYFTGLIGIAIGTVFFVMGPRLEQWQHHRTLLRVLTPLAIRVRQLYPAVVLDEEHIARQTPSIRAQRLVIEISDGLRLLPVQRDTSRPAGQIIADTLAADHHPVTGSTANDLLDRLPDTRSEQANLIDIAHRYGRCSQ